MARGPRRRRGAHRERDAERPRERRAASATSRRAQRAAGERRPAPTPPAPRRGSARRVAPSARRTPISKVRCATETSVVLATTTIAASSAIAPSSGAAAADARRASEQHEAARRLGGEHVEVVLFARARDGGGRAGWRGRDPRRAYGPRRPSAGARRRSAACGWRPVGALVGRQRDPDVAVQRMPPRCPSSGLHADHREGAPGEPHRPPERVARPERARPRSRGRSPPPARARRSSSAGRSAPAPPPGRGSRQDGLGAADGGVLHLARAGDDVGRALRGGGVDRPVAAVALEEAHVGAADRRVALELALASSRRLILAGRGDLGDHEGVAAEGARRAASRDQRQAVDRRVRPAPGADRRGHRQAAQRASAAGAPAGCRPPAERPLPISAAATTVQPSADGAPRVGAGQSRLVDRARVRNFSLRLRRRRSCCSVSCSWSSPRWSSRAAAAGAPEVDVDRVARRQPLPLLRHRLRRDRRRALRRHRLERDGPPGRSCRVREGDRVRAGQVLARIDAVPAGERAARRGGLAQALEADARGRGGRARRSAPALARARARALRGPGPPAPVRARQGARRGRLGARPPATPPRSAWPQGRAQPRRGARPPGQDRDHRADGRRRHPPRRARGGDGGGRRAEPAGDDPDDPLRPVLDRRRGQGRRGRRDAARGRPDGRRRRSRPCPDASSPDAWSRSGRARCRSPGRPPRRASSASSSGSTPAGAGCGRG